LAGRLGACTFFLFFAVEEDLVEFFCLAMLAKHAFRKLSGMEAEFRFRSLKI
jgi:hypothetical protein